MSSIATVPATDAPTNVVTGMRHIDDILGGGIPSGVVVDVFGGHGTGKTQMLHHIAARFAIHNRRVLYVDTSGTFRPERILQMAKNSVHPSSTISSQILEMISVARVQSVYEQMEIIDGLLRDTDGFDLVVIDSLTDLFLYEYSRYGDLKERNRAFFSHMRNIARLAVRNRITVMVSNMIRISGGVDSEVLAAEVGLFAHVKIHLAKKAARRDYVNASRLEGYVLCAIKDEVQDDDNDDDNNEDDNELDISTSHTTNDNFDKNTNYQESDVVFTYEILPTGIKTQDVPADDAFNLP